MGGGLIIAHLLGSVDLQVRVELERDADLMRERREKDSLGSWGANKLTLIFPLSPSGLEM